MVDPVSIESRLLERLLPLPPLTDVLRELAETWIAAFSARAAWIGCALSPQACASCLVSEEGAASHFLRAQPAEASALLERLAAGIPDDVGTLPATEFALTHADHLLGRVVVFGASAEVESVPRLADLSGRFLAQAAREHSVDASLEQAKLAALAEFAAGAGHEINNPLGTISGRVQLLLPGETDPERRRALTTIGGQAYRIRDMIGDLMLFARPPAPQFAAVRLDEVAADVIAKLSGVAGECECTLTLEASDLVEIRADVVQVAVVISNLVRNALEASPRGGKVVVGISSRGDAAGQGGGRLTVIDNGAGLRSTDLVHLFDPFYSGRQAGRGLGFGLSKCWRIVELHGGQISVKSAAGETRFEVDW
ncbi:MAG TPA: HAMP domain-containing sensor histidine kinase [Planctomycetaceae bacterium]|nr:HAMP domain-containing sensor histidine kinase [Planctomycetaceae bacterium]